jgi:hypothetical protein
MLGTGLTFAVGVGVVASAIGGAVWLGGGITSRELLQIVGKTSVVAGLLGVAFSCVLAITARGRQFNKLSLRLVASLGAGAGLLYFGFLAMNGGRNWSARAAVGNLVLLVLMGGVSASATFVIARRAAASDRASLQSDDALHRLGPANEEIVQGRSRSKVDVPRGR